MAVLTIYKLQFTTPLHIGDVHEDYSVSHQNIKSDAFYAALTAVLAKVGFNVPDNGDLGIRISSLFPYYQKVNKDDSSQNAVFFFPNPLLQIVKPNWKREIVKRVKKIKWVEASLFWSMIFNIGKFWDTINEDVLKGQYLTGADIPDDFIKSELVPRVKVSRTQKDAVPFYMDRIYFKDASGLFFIAQGDLKLLEKGLNVLMHEGIGTDRNIGNGYFTWEKDTIENVNLPESTFITNLSLFYPENQEQLTSLLNDENVAYDFSTRGGWITTPPYNSYRKNKINMFTEGSVFKYQKLNDIISIGKIEKINPTDLSINHQIFRNGKSIFFPIIIS